MKCVGQSTGFRGEGPNLFNRSRITHFPREIIMSRPDLKNWLKLRSNSRGGAVAAAVAIYPRCTGT